MLGRTAEKREPGRPLRVAPTDQVSGCQFATGWGAFCSSAEGGIQLLGPALGPGSRNGEGVTAGPGEGGIQLSDAFGPGRRA